MASNSLSYYILLFCFGLFASVSLGSCQDDDDGVDPPTAVDDSLAAFLQLDAEATMDNLVLPDPEQLESNRQGFNSDHAFYNDCYTVVFPVTLAFPDRTSVEVASAAEARVAVRNWVEAGGRTQDGRRPSLQYPYAVQLANGSVVDVDGDRVMQRIIAGCRPVVRPCYQLVYPLTYSFDGALEAYSTAEEARRGIASYLRNNPGADRPTLRFPVNVLDENGEVALVRNQGELDAIIADCNAGATRVDCYAFVYPLEVVSLDSRTPVTISNDDQLRRALSSAGGGYVLKYPYEVTLAGGQIRVVTSPQDWRRLLAECRGDVVDIDCYAFDYPVRFVNARGGTVLANDDAEFARAEDAGLVLQFPVAVILEDESTELIDAQAGLDQLRADCDADPGNGIDCFAFRFPISMLNTDQELITVDNANDLGFQRLTGSLIQYPITVTLEDDSERVLRSEPELRALEAECDGLVIDCFEPQYPVLFATARGGSVRATNRVEFDRYSASADHVIQFPFVVTLEDFSALYIEDAAAYDALRADCM